HSTFARLTTVRRPVQPARRDREDLAARLGDTDSMLELGRERAVAGDRRPAIGQDLHMRFAEIDHRLDGEQHAGLELEPFAGFAVMQDVRPVVEHAPQAVAAEITHYAAALAFGIGLNGRADIAGGGARL